MIFRIRIHALSNWCARRVFVFGVGVGGPSTLSTDHSKELSTNHTNSPFTFFIVTFFDFGFDLLNT